MVYDVCVYSLEVKSNGGTLLELLLILLDLDRSKIPKFYYLGKFGLCSIGWFCIAGCSN